MPVQLDLSTYGSIPKVIHVSWKNKTILEDQSPLILNGLANLKALNPNYTLEISDDKDVETYLKSHLNKWEYFKIKNKKIVEKIDLWRLFKMYHEGGIYVDIDRFCNIPFSTLIEQDTKCILPTHGDIDFSQDLMISCKHNPLFETAIAYNLKGRYLLNPRGVFHLGPPLFMRAVTEVVFGVRHKRKPGTAVMAHFRDLLDNSKHFQTYKENAPKDSILFTYNTQTFKKGNGTSKAEFYAAQNITPWANGFDKNTLIFAIIFAVVLLGFILYAML